MVTILGIIHTVTQERKERVTRPQLTLILRGSKSAEIKMKNFDELPGHGSCKDLDSDLLELILNRLEFLEIITSASESNYLRFHCEYLIVRSFLILQRCITESHIVRSKGSWFNAGSRTFRRQLAP
jgi:superfamily II DNA helicase RecQ